MGHIHFLQHIQDPLIYSLSCCCCPTFFLPLDVKRFFSFFLSLVIKSKPREVLEPKATTKSNPWITVKYRSITWWRVKYFFHNHFLEFLKDKPLLITYNIEKKKKKDTSMALGNTRPPPPICWKGRTIFPVWSTVPGTLLLNLLFLIPLLLLELVVAQRHNHSSFAPNIVTDCSDAPTRLTRKTCLKASCNLLNVKTVLKIKINK